MESLRENITGRNIYNSEFIFCKKEIKKVFEFWNSYKKEFYLPTSLLKKLSHISLKPQTLLSGILFFLYKNEADLSEELKEFIEGEYKDFYRESIFLYRKLNKVNQFVEPAKNSKQVELNIRMLLAVLADLQLLTVFLVLQLQKLEEIDQCPKNNIYETAWISLNIYAPLAGRLGIFWIKSELEDKAFRHLEYENYQILKKKIAIKQSYRSESVDKIIFKIKSILRKSGIKHEVQGRYKRFYSIFQKLKKVENNFDRIQDLIAFRILVSTVDECYTVLSFIHDNWTPLKNRFKDYIVKPKPNGYQSLHTTVQEVFEDSLEVPKTIEIQIRTQKMHRVAEYGVAAHWLYKENRKKNNKISSEGLRESLLKKEYSDSNLEIIPLIDLFRDKIYVMTPIKEIIELPKDASPIDFAYAIHTDIGNKTTGAKVNGKIIRLDGKLKNGQILEILTSPKQEPKKEWLELVKTRHARNKINHALHEQNRESNRKKGLEILEREFKEYGMHLNRQIREGKMEHLSRHYKNQEFEHILFCVGEGTIKIEEILSWFDINKKKYVKKELQKDNKFLKKENSFKISQNNTNNLILVDGMRNVMTRIAKCCSPELNDSITGYVTKEKMVSVHKEMCPFLKKLKPERIIKVKWYGISDI